MLFRRPLSIDSTLSVGAARAAMRAFATSRDMPDIAAYRRRQIIGWRLSDANEDVVFQPEYGETLAVDGARFVGLVEPASSGSRVRGRVVASPLTRIVVSVFMIAVVGAAVAGVRQGTEPPARVLSVASLMLGAALVMIRYSLWSTSRVVEARLRQSLSVSAARAAA
jgi:hypothetical protein